MAKWRDAFGHRLNVCLMIERSFPFAMAMALTLGMGSGGEGEGKDGSLNESERINHKCTRGRHHHHTNRTTARSIRRYI